MVDFLSFSPQFRYLIISQPFPLSQFESPSLGLYEYCYFYSMLTEREEELLISAKLKTEERVATLRHTKMHMTNCGTFLDTSAPRQARVIRLPFIKKRSDPLAEDFYSSRSSNHNSSHFIGEMGRRRREDLPVPRKDHSSSLIHNAFEKENVKGNNDRSLDLNTNKTVFDEEDRDKSLRRQRKALPRIPKHKYFKDISDKMQRIMSERNVSRVQEAAQPRYKLGSILGQGAYATVRLVKQESGLLLAMKCYDKSKITDDEKLENIKREIQILRRISHRNIIQLKDVTENNTHINIVTELVENMSLLDLIKSSMTNKLPQSQVKPLFRGLIEAVAYLHSKNIIHRDIKLENVLVSKNKHAKLIDFGFATEATSHLNIFCGTPSYISPEMILKRGYGNSVDVWALGVSLFKMLCGHFPFKGVSHKALYHKISKGSFKFSGDLSMNAQILISKMLCVDVDSRLTAEEVLQEPWFLAE